MSTSCTSRHDAAATSEPGVGDLELANGGAAPRPSFAPTHSPYEAGEADIDAGAPREMIGDVPLTTSSPGVQPAIDAGGAPSAPEGGVR